MKKSKEQKAKEKLAKLMGVEAPTEVRAIQAHDTSMEGEATLEYFENPRSFREKVCKNCKRSFATRGAPVAYCSDPCRVKAFEERMGVTWKPYRRPEDRYGYLGEPLTVSPEGLTMAQAVMAEQEAVVEKMEAEPDPGDIAIDEWPGYGETVADLDSDTLDILADLDLE